MNSNKNRKTIMAATICLLLGIWLPMVTSSKTLIPSPTTGGSKKVTSSPMMTGGAAKEVKPSHAMKLCGKDFITAWAKICQLKQMKSTANKKGRKRRSLQGIEISHSTKSFVARGEDFLILLFTLSLLSKHNTTPPR